MTTSNHIQLGSCLIASSVRLLDGCVIGKPFRPLIGGAQEDAGHTNLAQNVYVGYYSVVGARTMIGARTIIDDYCIIESGVTTGENNLIIYRAQICNDVRLGNNCVIGGFIGERTVVGDSCRIFGKLIHLQHNPNVPWDADEAIEASPVIGDYCFIGFDAVIAGPVKIGCRAYVCSGAIVTRDVPDYHIASGTNRITHFSKWKGSLRLSPFFK